MAKILEITQLRSIARCTQPQVRTIEALGLRKIRHSVKHPDSPQLRGQLRVVAHLVEVKEVEA
jgi:large subunit ribosomal protein L30